MIRTFNWEMMHAMPVVGIFRNVSATAQQQIMKHYYEAGLTNIEITMNTPGATQMIASLVAQYDKQLNIGAGTVLTLNQLEEALAAGASFIVTPIVNEDVISACVKKNVPIFPGAYTPTEIYKAWTLGASMVKIFPASKLGIDYIKEVLAPLNELHLIPTGSINLDNCTDFLKAGAKGLGLATSLFPKAFIEQENWPALRELFEQYVSKIKAFKG